MYYNGYRDVHVFIKSRCISRFSSIVLSVSFVPTMSPIVMYDLRLFIQELHCCLHVDIIRVIGLYRDIEMLISVEL